MAAQVVNKTPYCSFPEFNTKVAGETLTQNAYYMNRANGYVATKNTSNEVVDRLGLSRGQLNHN